MDKSVVWYNEAIGKKVVAALIKNRFTAEYAPDKQSAIAAALEAIPAGASIGLGGSVTTQGELGLVDKLRQRGCNIIDWRAPGLSKEEQDAVRLRGVQADVFLTSTNAVTMDGQLINVDGTGNRVAAIAYGPGKVVMLAGVNKIVPNVDEGLKRLRTVASPLNNKRLGCANPCTVTGVCVNCDSPTRICNVTTIMHKNPSRSKVHIILVGESLGY